MIPGARVRASGDGDTLGQPRPPETGAAVCLFRDRGGSAPGERTAPSPSRTSRSAASKPATTLAGVSASNSTAAATVRCNSTRAGSACAPTSTSASAARAESAEITGTAATRAAGDVMEPIVKELKKSGKFTLPSFGASTVRKTKARKGLNPRTGEAIKVKAGKTVRFKASPTLKKAV